MDCEFARSIEINVMQHRDKTMEPVGVITDHPNWLLIFVMQPRE